MHAAIIRCFDCHRGLERKRAGWAGREVLDVCECTPWIQQPVFIEVSHLREVGSFTGKVVQRE